MVEASLYQMCLSYVSNRLIANHLRPDTSPNPFLGSPPSVVSDLVECICRNVRGRLKSSYLHLLIASNRILHFKLNNVELETKDAEDIFHDLQSTKSIIQSITIQEVFLEGSDIIKNLGSLIQSSECLKSVETCIGFPLIELSYSKSLTELTLNYVIRSELKSYEELRRLPPYNNSLRVLKLFKEQASPRLCEEIEKIMKYCLELTEIEFDVGETLEYIYEKNKSQKFKLKKTILGSESCFGKRANEKAVSIASAVCPDLQSVEVTPEDYSSIHALRNFRHITNLILSKPKLNFNDYHEGVHPLLEISHFGTNLTSLSLYFFADVDFTSIGTCCPNLEVLEVEYFSADNALNPPQNSYNKLFKLNLRTFLNRPCEASTLCTILPNASALEILKIDQASALNDDVLDEILEDENVLSKLKSLYLKECGLTVRGLEKLARRVNTHNSLIHVSVSSSSITEEEARSILIPTPSN